VNAICITKKDLICFSLPILIKNTLDARKNRNAAGYPNDIKKAPTNPVPDPIFSLVNVFAPRNP